MHRVINYGSFLQAYALKRIVEGFGHDCEFRDFARGAARHQGEKLRIPSVASRLRKLPSVLAAPGARIQKRRFRQRIEQVFRDICAPLLGLAPEKNYDLRCDLMIIGSDEVFNYAQNASFGYVPCLFGYDIQAMRIVAYAASAGYTNAEDVMADNMTTELAGGFGRIECLSVRDRNTREIVHQCDGRRPPIVLDPTLLYDFSSELSPASGSGDFLLVYAYQGRMEARHEVDTVRTFARSHGLRLVSVCFFHDWCDENLAPEPFVLLDLFRAARFVVTDTFHGTVFSIKFGKQFVTLLRDTNIYGSNANKVGYLLEQFELRRQGLSTIDELPTALARPIDHARTKLLLTEGRRQSMAFLTDALAIEVDDRKTDVVEVAS